MFPVEHYGDVFHGEHFVQAEVYVQSLDVYEKKWESQNGKIDAVVMPVRGVVGFQFSRSFVLDKFGHPAGEFSR
jgi:hypothetical protein